MMDVKMLVSQILVFFLFVNCGGKSPENIKPSEDLLTADLLDLKFNFEGHEFSYPLTVGEFVKTTGWDSEYSLSQKIDARSVITNRDLAFRNSGRAVFIEAGNDTDSKLPFSECKIVSMSIPNNNHNTIFGQKSCTVILPKGIVFSTESSTREEIVAAYGEPEKQSEDNLYYSDGIRSVNFSLKDGRIYYINIDTGGTTIYDLY